MKLLIGTIFLITLYALTSADPKPTGGALCNINADCGGSEFISDAGGICKQNTTNPNAPYIGYCVCNKKYGNPDCSYKRISKDLAGGLQFICFLGVGGVGNFVLERNGAAAGQLILMFACFAFFSMYCAACMDVSEFAIVFGGIISCLICVVGFIWCIVDGALILQGKINDGNGYTTF